MTNDHYVVNAPAVVSEIIDGEAVIMNLKSGNYYSSDKCGVHQLRERATSHLPESPTSHLFPYYS